MKRADSPSYPCCGSLNQKVNNGRAVFAQDCTAQLSGFGRGSGPVPGAPTPRLLMWRIRNSMAGVRWMDCRCVRVCACERMCVWECVRELVCRWVRVCFFVCLLVRLLACLWVGGCGTCVCACMRVCIHVSDCESERDTEWERERESERQSVRGYEFGHMCTEGWVVYATSWLPL